MDKGYDGKKGKEKKKKKNLELRHTLSEGWTHHVQHNTFMYIYIYNSGMISQLPRDIEASNHNQLQAIPNVTKPTCQV